MQAYRARYVFPIVKPPIEGGVVTLRDGRIVAVGRHADGAVHDLGNVALLPALVNAHTHLEFSSLAEPLGEPGMPLPEWIRLVLDYRRNFENGASDIARGLTESLRGGVGALGEIATFDWRDDAAICAQDRPRLLMFYESIGPTAAHVEPLAASAEDFVSRNVSLPGLMPALSPHAPYTVHPALLERLIDLAARRGLSMAMHLAESPEELELLRSGSGRFRTLLEDMNAWDPAPDARLSSVLGYFERLSRAPRALAVHGNYLTADELAFLAERRKTMTVVYCPRTHFFFRHPAYPLAEMLHRGVRVALGTDSRASNPDLCLFEEMRFVARHHAGLAPAEVLRLGTEAGAHALGLPHELGTLAPGKAARFCTITLPDRTASDPHELLFDPVAEVRQENHRGTETPRSD